VVLIVQAFTVAGIVIGVAGFGTVPDAMIVIVLQHASGLAPKRVGAMRQCTTGDALR